MLKVINLANVRDIVLGRNSKTSRCPHFQDIVQRLYSNERAGVAADLRSYEEAGVVTARMDDILTRVDILREADRLLTKFSEETELAA